MKEPHILRAGNPRRIKANLREVLDESALDALEQALRDNVSELVKLARQHYRFAARLGNFHWRHSVSRAYYGAYCAARAIRLFHTGHYSMDVKDHQRFGELPEEFPQKDRFANQLAVLREDRNACDYDHTIRASDLVLSKREALALVEDFLAEVDTYLRTKGVTR